MAKLKPTHPARLFENGLLVLLGCLALSVFGYQLRRWAYGLEPDFVHPRWLETSPVPLLLRMATVHPLIWLALIIGSFARICRNYGWRLRK